MGALKFDGIDDRVEWTTLAAALANVSDGAWTCAVLFRKDVLKSWNGISYIENAARTTQEAGMSFNNDAGGSQVQLDTLRGGNANTTTPAIFDSLTNVHIIAASKGAGTVVPRLGYVNLTAATAWAHAAFSTTVADAQAGAIMKIGDWVSSDYHKGWIGLVGWWEGAMSDVQKESLSTNKKTSDWWTHAFGAPKFLCELNVAATALVDLAGNASALATFGGGPTLDSGEALAGWTFDGTGAAVPVVTTTARKAMNAKGSYR